MLSCKPRFDQKCGRDQNPGHIEEARREGESTSGFLTFKLIAFADVKTDWFASGRE